MGFSSYIRRKVNCISIALIICLLALSLSCSSTSGEQEEVLAALQKTGEAESYRFSQVTSGYSYGDIQEYHSETEVASSDYYHSRVVGNSSITEFVQAGNESYVRINDEEWRECTEGTCGCTVVMIPDSLSFLRYLEVEQMIEKETTVDGTECRYYRGEVDVDSWATDKEGASTGDAIYETPYLDEIRHWQVNAQLWIDNNNYIRQIKTDVFYPYTDTITGEREWGSVISVATYSSFNEDILITKPVLN